MFAVAITLLILVVIGITTGAISINRNFPDKSITIRKRHSDLSDFCGVYSNKGVDHTSRTQRTLIEQMMFMSKEDADRIETVEIRLVGDADLEIRGMNNGTELIKKIWKEDQDFIFVSSTLSGRHYSESRSVWFVAAKEKHHQYYYLTPNGSLAHRYNKTSVGIATFIPFWNQQKSIYVWSRIK